MPAFPSASSSGHPAPGPNDLHPAVRGDDPNPRASVTQRGRESAADAALDPDREVEVDAAVHGAGLELGGRRASCERVGSLTPASASRSWISTLSFSEMVSAISFWQPIASTVTMQPLNSSTRNSSGTAVLMATHDLTVDLFSDVIYHLEDGRIVDTENVEPTG